MSSAAVVVGIKNGPVSLVYNNDGTSLMAKFDQNFVLIDIDLLREILKK